jgi:hypothetical protein
MFARGSSASKGNGVRFSPEVRRVAGRDLSRRENQTTDLNLAQPKSATGQALENPVGCKGGIEVSATEWPHA